jgi:hypothetical protein
MLCDIVDDMDRALKFIYTHLRAHAADTKAYSAATRGLQEKVQRLKRREEANMAWRFQRGLVTDHVREGADETILMGRLECAMVGTGRPGGAHKGEGAR